MRSKRGNPFTVLYMLLLLKQSVHLSLDLANDFGLVEVSESGIGWTDFWPPDFVIMVEGCSFGSLY